MEILIKWLGRSDYVPLETIEYDQGLRTLSAFKNAWLESKTLPRLRADLATKIALVVERSDWTPDDLAILQEHWSNLDVATIPEASAAAASVQKVISSLEKREQSPYYQQNVAGPWHILVVIGLCLSKVPDHSSYLFLEPLGSPYYRSGLHRFCTELDSLFYGKNCLPRSKRPFLQMPRLRTSASRPILKTPKSP